jgi:hypothetical protein
MKQVQAVPEAIEALLAEGFWPRDNGAAQLQNLNSLVSPEAVRAFAPEEARLFLYPPPFITVREEMAHNRFWSDPRSASSEIDPDRTLIIGDFGLGSDAPIALDYSRHSEMPSVIRLRWGADGNHWVEVAPDVRTFVAYLKA